MFYVHISYSACYQQKAGQYGSNISLYIWEVSMFCASVLMTYCGAFQRRELVIAFDQSVSVSKVMFFCLIPDSGYAYSHQCVIFVFLL